MIDLWVKSCPLSVSANKVLLTHSHVHPCIVCGGFPTTMAGMRSWNRDHIAHKTEVFSGTPPFGALHRYCICWKLKVYGHPVSSKSIAAIFPTAFVHFMSLGCVSVILAICQTFSLLLHLLWWSVISDLWCYYYNCRCGRNSKRTRIINGAWRYGWIPAIPW